MTAVKTDASFPGIPFGGVPNAPCSMLLITFHRFVRRRKDTDFDASVAIILRNSHRESHTFSGAWLNVRISIDPICSRQNTKFYKNFNKINRFLGYVTNIGISKTIFKLLLS